MACPITAAEHRGPEAPLPPARGRRVELVKGPNIGALPDFDSLPDRLVATVAIRVGDDVSTDEILPPARGPCPSAATSPSSSSSPSAGSIRTTRRGARRADAARRRRRAQLRSGLVARTRRDRAEIPGSAAGDRQVLCPHPLAEPGQLRGPALEFADEADYDRSRPATGSSSTHCPRRCAAVPTSGCTTPLATRSSPPGTAYRHARSTWSWPAAASPRTGAEVSEP